MENREELVEWASRQPGTLTRFLTLPLVAKIAAGVGLIAVAGVTIAVLAAAFSDSEPESASDVDVTPFPTATPAPATPTATAIGPVDDITRVSLSRGETIQGEWGLVTGNKLTGGAEVWLMPEGTVPSGISPSGRYFVWEDDLFDAWTGARTTLNARDSSIALASFSPGESAVYVQDAGGGGRVLAIDGRAIAELPDVGGAPVHPPSQSHVVWSPDSRALAVTRYVADSSQVDVVVDGAVRLSVEGGGQAAWSSGDLRLAVMAGSPAIYDLRTGASVPLARGGAFPSWSPDDRYIAVPIADNEVPGLSVADAATGHEIVRIYNLQACFDIYWEGEHHIPWNEQAVDVETGQLVSRPGPSSEPAAPYFRVDDTNMVQWTDASGVYAEARVQGNWAASFSWTRRDIDQWPPVFLLGLGGKDACLGSPEEIVIVRPPFTPDQVPTATPTPDK